MLEKIFDFLFSRFGFFTFILIAIPIPPLAYFHALIYNSHTPFSLISPNANDLTINCMAIHTKLFNQVTGASWPVVSLMAIMAISFAWGLFKNWEFRNDRDGLFYRFFKEDAKIAFSTCSMVWVAILICCATKFYAEEGKEDGSKFATAPQAKIAAEIKTKSGEVIFANSIMKIGTQFVINIRTGESQKIIIIKEDETSRITIPPLDPEYPQPDDAS